MITTVPFLSSLTTYFYMSAYEPVAACQLTLLLSEPRMSLAALLLASLSDALLAAFWADPVFL